MRRYVVAPADSLARLRQRVLDRVTSGEVTVAGAPRMIRASWMSKDRGDKRLASVTRLLPHEHGPAGQMRGVLRLPAVRTRDAERGEAVRPERPAVRFALDESHRSVSRERGEPLEPVRDRLRAARSSGPVGWATSDTLNEVCTARKVTNSCHSSAGTTSNGSAGSPHRPRLGGGGAGAGSDTGVGAGASSFAAAASRSLGNVKPRAPTMRCSVPK